MESSLKHIIFISENLEIRFFEIPERQVHHCLKYVWDVLNAFMFENIFYVTIEYKFQK